MITQDKTSSDILMPPASISETIPGNGQRIYKNASALSDAEMDRFGRLGFSRKIATAVSQRKNQSSIAMSLNGPDGCGKTTILNFIENELRLTGSTSVIRFNPTVFKNEEEITGAFFEALGSLRIIHSEVTGKSSYTELINDYAGILLHGSSALIHHANESPDNNVTEHYFSVKDKEIIKDRISEYFAEAGKHTAVLIDDIDKLHKSLLKAILRLIKLHANFPNTIYILTFENNQAAGMLGNGTDKIETGRKFLEKIFQVSIDIPPLEKGKLEKFCFDIVTDLLNEHNVTPGNGERKQFFRAIRNGFSVRLDIKKCMQYRKALSDSLTGNTEGSSIGDLLLLGGIQIFYPDIHEIIKNKSGHFQNNGNGEGRETSAQSVLNLIEEVIAGYSDTEKRAVIYLVSTLFPAELGYGETEHSPASRDEQLQSGTRPDETVDQYFIYQDEPKEPEGNNLDDLLSILENADTNTIGEKIGVVSGSIGNDALIEMLIERNGSISETGSINLINALGATGSGFTNPDSLFSFTTVFSHPGIVIRELLENIAESTKRFQTASDLLLKSEPVNFAFEAYRWMCAIDEGEGARLFSVSEEEQLGRMLAERIAYLAYGEPVYIKNPEEAPFLLDTWAYLAGREVTSNYLQRTFEENKENITAFIKCYLPADAGLNEAGSIRLDQFNSIGKVIEHKDVFSSLLDSAGEDFLIDAVQSKDRSTSAAAKFARAYKDFAPVRNTLPVSQNSRRNEQASPDSRRKFVQVKKGIYRPYTPDLEI